MHVPISHHLRPHPLQRPAAPLTSQSPSPSPRIAIAITITIAIANRLHTTYCAHPDLGVRVPPTIDVQDQQTQAQGRVVLPYSDVADSDSPELGLGSRRAGSHAHDGIPDMIEDDEYTRDDLLNNARHAASASLSRAQSSGSGLAMRLCVDPYLGLAVESARAPDTRALWAIGPLALAGADG